MRKDAAAYPTGSSARDRALARLGWLALGKCKWEVEQVKAEPSGS